jgi:hypothetical protein
MTFSPFHSACPYKLYITIALGLHRYSRPARDQCLCYPYSNSVSLFQLGFKWVTARKNIYTIAQFWLSKVSTTTYWIVLYCLVACGGTHAVSWIDQGNVQYILHPRFPCVCLTDRRASQKKVSHGRYECRVGIDWNWNCPHGATGQQQLCKVRFLFFPKR